MPIYFRRPFVLNSDCWTAGSGSVCVYNQNGTTEENERLNSTDPFGQTSLVWEAQSAGTNTGNGGWNVENVPLDNTKLYRFTVWIRRTSASSTGRTYFGCGNGNTHLVKLSDNLVETNPYWYCPLMSSLTQNTWYLYVGHIFPYNYSGGTHPNTGIWTVSGGKTALSSGFCNAGGDLRFDVNTTSTRHRAYLFYSSDAADRLQFFDPRVVCCDGSEGSIESLLSNEPETKLSNTTITKEGASYDHITKVIASGGTITEVGEWRIHTFTDTSTFKIDSTYNNSLEIEYLLVGGGGGGGMDMGGGGGGGGVLTGRTVLTGSTYVIVVGAGGVGAPAGGTGGQPSSHQFTIGATAGGNTIFNGLTVYGGGYGASSYYGYTPDYGNAGSGGCGGAPSAYANPGGTRSGGSGVTGQGFAGGSNNHGQYYGAGGGGAGAIGTSSTSRPDGGPGRLVGIFGRPYYFGGGGGGSSYSISQSGNGGIGGGGGGGYGTGGTGGKNSIGWGANGGTSSCTGCWAQVPGGNGGTNTGGGGGGGSHYNSNNKGGNGGSGVVVIRYRYR